MFAVLASIFAIVGSYDRISNMTSFSFLLFFAFTSIGFLWWRRAIPASGRDKKFWVITVVAVSFLIGTAWLIVTTALRASVETLAAIGLIGLEIPIVGVLEVVRRGAKLPP